MRQKVTILLLLALTKVLSLLVAPAEAAATNNKHVICLKSLPLPINEVKGGDIVYSGNKLNLFVGDQFSNGNNGSVIWLTRNASHGGAWVNRGRLEGTTQFPQTYKGYKIASSFNGKYVVFSGSFFRDDTLPRPLRGELWIFGRNNEETGYEQQKYVYEVSGGLGAEVGMNGDGTIVVATMINNIATFKRVGNKWTRLANSPAKFKGYEDGFYMFRGNTIFSPYIHGLTAFNQKHKKWTVNPKQSAENVLDVGFVLDLSMNARTIAYAEDDYGDDETDYNLSFKCRQSTTRWRRCFKKQPIDSYQQDGFPSAFGTMQFSRDAKSLIARIYFMALENESWVRHSNFALDAPGVGGFLSNPEIYFREDHKATRDKVVTAFASKRPTILTVDCVLSST